MFRCPAEGGSGFSVQVSARQSSAGGGSDFGFQVSEKRRHSESDGYHQVRNPDN
jgi:hypothetical protein